MAPFFDRNAALGRLASNARNIHPAFVALLLVVANPLAAQEIHRWTDEDGVVHYGDSPPSDSQSNSEIVREKPPAKPNTITKASGEVDVSETDGVTKYVLHVGEEGIANAPSVVRLTATQNRLWITRPNQILSFDPQTTESIKYTFNHLYSFDPFRGKLQGNQSQITSRRLVFLARDRYATRSELHVYDLTQDSYYTASLDSGHLQLISYNDHYGDGLFTFNFADNVLIRYNDVPDSAEGGSIDTTEYPMDGTVYASNLATNKHTAWYLGSAKETCSPGFIDKRDGTHVRFSYKDIGFLSEDRCRSIVVDEEEAWLSARKSTRNYDSKIAIYDIEAKRWEILQEDANGQSFVVGELLIDSDRLYYRGSGCSEITAMDRKSRIVKTIDVRDYGVDAPAIGCVVAYTVHNGYLWSLGFHTRDRQRYPVLYKIPLYKFDQ